jgi:hypothetical protein
MSRVVRIGTSRLPTIPTTTSRLGEKVHDSIWKHPNFLLAAIGIFSHATMWATLAMGGAILPLIQGVIAGHIGLKHAFFVPLARCLYILILWAERIEAQTANDTR